MMPRRRRKRRDRALLTEIAPLASAPTMAIAAKTQAAAATACPLGAQSAIIRTDHANHVKKTTTWKVTAVWHAPMARPRLQPRTKK